jgi:hypothetical protein
MTPQSSLSISIRTTLLTFGKKCKIEKHMLGNGSRD